jgi:hypothetical protein
MFRILGVRASEGQDSGFGILGVGFEIQSIGFERLWFRVV